MRGESSPADEYFEDFLAEFHLRQRQDLMRRSARSLLYERVGVSVRQMGRTKWMYGAAAGYALFMVVFFLWPKSGSANEGVEPVSWEVPERKVVPFEDDSAGRKKEAPGKATDF